MIRKAMKMTLFPGFQEEYKKRHDELWPEMREMLSEHGAKNYYIYLDKDTDTLFGFLEIEDEETWSNVPLTEINKKWWDYMADIMETNEDNSPVTTDLIEVFEL